MAGRKLLGDLIAKFEAASEHRVSLECIGGVDAAKRVQIDRHLQECRGCYSRAEFEKALRERIAQLGDVASPAALRQRIRSLIDEF